MTERAGFSMLYYQSGAATNTGKRSNNQDNYYLNGVYNPEIHTDGCDEQAGQARTALFAVADGMGGENCGERASYLLVQNLSKIAIKEDAGLAGAVTRAIIDTNDALCSIMKQDNTGRIGSTVVTLLIADSTVFISNLGDSPAYLCRNNTLIKLTKDHTEGQVMLDGGVLTKEQLAHHPSQNRLTRHLGIFPSELELEVAEYEPITPQINDVFLICSDGVSGVLSDKSLIEILSGNHSAREIADTITTEAILQGSKDNCTALVVKIASVAFSNEKSCTAQPDVTQMRSIESSENYSMVDERLVSQNIKPVSDESSADPSYHDCEHEEENVSNQKLNQWFIIILIVDIILFASIVGVNVYNFYFR